jgi:hypothetical protein
VSELTPLIEAGDVEAVRRWSLAHSEKERRTFAAESAEAARRAEDGEWKQEGDRSWWASAWTRPQQDAARMAFFSTCSLAELRRHAANRAVGPEIGAHWGALRPSWLEDAAEAVVDANANCWTLARRLVRDGLSKRPTNDNYILGMFTHGFGGIRERLAEDAALLEHEVWRLFEVEGGGEQSLAAHDKYSRPDLTWSAALLALSESGALPRARLLDASLDALGRDFATFRAGWFARFHEALRPTLDERSARLSRYLRLLGSSVGPTVSLALDAVLAVDAAAPITADSLLPHVAPLAVARTKATAKAVLGLLARVAKREPASSSKVARAAAEALAHEATDIQGAALGLLAALDASRFDELRGRIAELAPMVAPSLRPKLTSFVGAAEPAPTPVLIAASSASGPAPRLDPSRAIVPIESVEVLLDRFAHVLEDDGEPDEIERVLDGVARLCGERTGAFERDAKPLLQRARKLRARAGERPVAWTLAGLAIAWIAREHAPAPTPSDAARIDLGAVFDAYVDEIACDVVAGRARPRLAAPTHRGGAIDPRVLVERVASWKVPVAPLHEATIALLRLSREGRDEALVAAERLPGEVGEAVRHALGAEHGTVGANAALWIAAARARDALGDDLAVAERHPDTGADGALAARCSWRIETRRNDPYVWRHIELESERGRPAATSIQRPSVLFHLRRDWSSAAGHQKSQVRWASTVWPDGIEAFVASGITSFSQNLDWSEAAWKNVAFLEPLRDACTPLGPLATLLLVLGLAAREPGEHGVAVDAAVAAVAEGRTDAERLGEAMARLLPTGLIKAARWAKTLPIVAAASPAHARVVCAAIQRAFRGDPSAGPRDEGTLVDCLRELLAGAGAVVEDAEARAYLGSGRHRKKLTGLLGS